MVLNYRVHTLSCEETPSLAVLALRITWIAFGQMVGKMASAPYVAAARHPARRRPRYLAPMALAAVMAAIVLVVVTAPGSSGPQRRPAHALTTAVRRLPPYWTVRPGDTFTRIAERTGLTVAQLEALNPNVDPMDVVPGQRLNLWLHPPAPRPRPLGPRFWTVRAGESFGLIAAKTGINLATLEQLNPGLKPSTLQPGARVTLRR